VIATWPPEVPGAFAVLPRQREHKTKNRRLRRTSIFLALAIRGRPLVLCRKAQQSTLRADCRYLSRAGRLSDGPRGKSV
jgi:hypothetical protein